MKAEIRSNGALRVSGYVNAVERDSRVLKKRMAHDAPGDFVEKVAAGAFGRAVARNSNIRMMFNHERDIGSTATGELKLTEDAIGLYAQADITDEDIIAAARRGELRGWSFGFTDPSSEWSDAGGGLFRRSLKDFELREVSLLTEMPAYFGTSVEMRSDETAEVEFRAADDTAPAISSPAEAQHDRDEINRYRRIIAGLSSG